MPRQDNLPARVLPADGHTEAAVYLDYVGWLDTLVAVTTLLVNVPLAQMAAVNERMQTLAPFHTAPMAYARGSRNLQQQRKLIAAAAALQTVVRELPQ